MTMEKDFKKELNSRMRAAWTPFAPIKEATDELTDQDLRAHLFDSALLPALCYAAETWVDTVATSTLSSHKQLVTIVPWANMETTSELIRTTTSAAEIDKENFYDDSAFLEELNNSSSGFCRVNHPLKIPYQTNYNNTSS
ncbi:hypothetical protein RB195_019219 [Necator americanus]|uniref:Uncharacterized protein n=1 Tax=Necator americanus TaxID=51031 RepID=A0ABR1CE75_NECAM